MIRENRPIAHQVPSTDVQESRPQRAVPRGARNNRGWDGLSSDIVLQHGLLCFFEMSIPRELSVLFGTASQCVAQFKPQRHSRRYGQRPGWNGHASTLASDLVARVRESVTMATSSELAPAMAWPKRRRPAYSKTSSRSCPPGSANACSSTTNPANAAWLNSAKSADCRAPRCTQLFDPSCTR